MLGRYLLGDRLGTGGMGEVYLAVQTGIGSFEKPLALKLLLPHLSGRENAVRMFLDEARLAARMNHGNITQIFDVGVVDGRYFIAMELVQGVSLAALTAALAKRQSPPAIELVLYVARSLCEGLHHAHQLRGPDGKRLGLVHHDVTPHNVLLSIDGAVKLADFGIARAAGTLTAEQGASVMGKRAWFAPEQLHDGPVDLRADLYSTALTILHFATLRPPGPDLAEASLDPALKAALARALNPAPAKRFPDARAFADALPAPSVDAARALAELVRTSCVAELTSLDAKTQQTLKLPRGTESLSNVSSSGPLAPETRARWGWAAVALVLAGGAATVGWFTLSRPSTVAAVAAPIAPAAGGRGFLTVDADPWARVWVDGKLLGETPLSSVALEAGEVDVDLKNPETQREAHRHVVITAGQRTYVKETLR